MNDLFKKLTALRSEKLTLSEREELRVKLLTRMETYAEAPMRNTFSFMLPVRYKRAIGFTIASLLAVSTGASYAAASALPGDILYPIKINVNERIETALAVTPKASAEVAARQIKRRAIEAEILAKENRLDETKKDQLAEETKVHVDAYNSARAKIERKGDRALAEELEGNIHRTIQEHEHALTDIGVVTVSTSTDTNNATTTSLRGTREEKGEFFERTFPADKESVTASSSSSEPSSDMKGEREGNILREQRKEDLPRGVKNEDIHNQIKIGNDLKIEDPSVSSQKDTQEDIINIGE